MRSGVINFLAGVCLVCAASHPAAAAGYDASVGESAYSVVLWKNGDPATERIITGRYADLNGEGVGEHDLCRVVVRRDRVGADTHWTIQVSPKADWGVAEVHYPLLVLPRLPNDFLLVGQRCGQRFPMSFVERHGEKLANWSMQEDARGVTDLFNKTSIFWGRYPSSILTMQMLGYENDEEGVLIWTADPQVYVKDFVVSREDIDVDRIGKAYRAYVVHFPENTGQRGTGFDSPYPVVTTPYQGGWQSAADIYGAWARQQWWCAQGKLYQRPSTPDWYRQVHVWYGVAGRPGWVRKWLDTTTAYLDRRPVGAQLMNWSNYHLPEWLAAPDFRTAADPDGMRANLALHDQGVYLSVYMLLGFLTAEHEEMMHAVGGARRRTATGQTLTRHHPVDVAAILERPESEIPPGVREMARRAVKLQDDLRAAWSAPIDHPLIARLDEFPMDQAIRDAQKKQLQTSWGQDQQVINRLKFFVTMQRLDLGDPAYRDFCVNMACGIVRQYGARSIYFDTFPHTTTPCFDPNHSHPPGYGRWMAQADRALIEGIRKQYPAMVFACESGGGEHLLDLMHLTYHKGIIPQYAVPLFSAVYHGYTDYTNWWMWPPYKTDEDFASLFARGQHIGFMPGGAVAGGILAQFNRELNLSKDDPKVRFALAAVDLRRTHRDFLAAGNRLRDPVVAGPAEEVYHWSLKGSGENQVRLSPVQASKWGHVTDPARVLLLLSNSSKTTRKATIDGVTYEVPAMGWRAVELHQDHP